MADASSLGQGLLSGIVVKSIRSFLNKSIEGIRPGQIVAAIRQDVSLWQVAGNRISRVAEKIPPSWIAAGRPMYRVAISEYGSATNLVLEWLKEDNPVMYSLVINTEGGMAWFDRQVQEICKQYGLEYQ